MFLQQNNCRFPLVPMTYLASGPSSRQQCGVWVSSHRMGLNTIKEWLAAHSCNLSTWEAKARGLMELEVNLGYTAISRPAGALVWYSVSQNKLVSGCGILHLLIPLCRRQRQVGLLSSRPAKLHRKLQDIYDYIQKGKRVQALALQHTPIILATQRLRQKFKVSLSY